MDRRNFLLKSTGAFCAAALGAGALLESCGKKNKVSPKNVNFTLDLTASSNAALNKVGGSVYHDSIIVIRTGTSSFAALSDVCTHMGCTVSYDGSNNVLYCPCHGGTFGLNGKVLGGPPPSPLPTYKTSLSGNTLTVTS